MKDIFDMNLLRQYLTVLSSGLLIDVDEETGAIFRALFIINVNAQ